MFKVHIDKQALKFLERLKDKQLRKRIMDKIDELEQEPFPKECRSVEGYDRKVYRVRVGDYRILYYVVFETNDIHVFIIDKRERVYS